jgi:DNA-binding LacI/PurR family transcriptional regulator
VLVNSSTFRASRSGYLEGLSRELVSTNMAMVTHYVNDSECDDILNPHKQPWVMKEDGGLGGLVLLHRWPENVVIELYKRWPVVSIMHEYPVAGTDYIGVNNSQGILVLMKKLREKGHEKIGFFGLSPALSWARARYAAYMEAACKLDIKIAPEHVIQLEPDYPEKRKFPHWDVHYDYVAAQIHQGVKAWMCASELAAHELYKGLKTKGFKVPEDVAITGFDAVDNSGLSDLPLTSIRVHSPEMGAGAVRLLILRMNNPSISRQVLKYDCDFTEGQTI